jgi:hypothetical protein
MYGGFIMKMLKLALIAGFAIAMVGCGKKSPTDIIVNPPDTSHHAASNIVVFDDFNTVGSVQNSIGKALGEYKVSNMNDTDKSAGWGGGFWYAYASTNGAKVLNLDTQVILNGTQESVDDSAQIVKLMSDGRLEVEFNCQNITNAEPFWAGVGCEFAGDPEHPFIFDSLKYHGDKDSGMYWDLSALDSIRLTMHGQGTMMLFLESYAVKHAFSNPDDVYGHHGVSITLDSTSVADKIYSIPVGNLKTNQDEALVKNITWDQAKTAISGISIELDTENDDRLEASIDKIEFVFKDTTAAFFSFDRH